MKNHFHIIGDMAEKNMDVRLAPLDNIIRANLTKKGGEVTIGVPAEIIHKLATEPGFFVGGLILANALQFNAMKNENLTPAKND